MSVQGFMAIHATDRYFSLQVVDQQTNTAIQKLCFLTVFLMSYPTDWLHKKGSVYSLETPSLICDSNSLWDTTESGRRECYMVMLNIHFQ